MQDSLDLIYSIFDTHNIKNKTKEDIYIYIKSYVLFLSNYDSKNATVNVVSIIIDFERYIKKGYFYDKKYITINKKHESYILYIEKINKCTEIISNTFNNLSLYNKKQNIDENFEIHNNEQNIDEYINDEDNEDDEDYIEEIDDISKISTSSSIKNLSDISNSTEYTEINQNFSAVSSVLYVSSASSVSSNENNKANTDKNCNTCVSSSIFSPENTKANTSQNEIFVFNSLTYSNKFYFINKDLTSCSCEAYKYCKLSVKYCKHLEELNNNFSNNDLLIINKNDKKCNCSRFISHKNCMHISKYNKYLDKITI